MSGMMEFGGISVDDLLNSVNGFDILGATLPNMNEKQLRSVVQSMVAKGRQAMPARQGANVLRGFGSPDSVTMETRPSQVRGRLIPINSTGTVAAGGTQLIRLQPQGIGFRGERFIYGGAAATFTITDFRILNQPQFMAAGEVAADIFVPQAQDTLLNFDPCPVGGLIEITVLNISGGAATFRAAFLGSGVINAVAA